MTLCAPALNHSAVPKLSPLECFTESPNHNQSLHSDETTSRSDTPESELSQRENINQTSMSGRLLKPDQISPASLKRPSVSTPDSQKRRRIDDICTSILQPTRSPKQMSDSGHSSDTNTSKPSNKRKAFKPMQQQGSALSPNRVERPDDFVTVDIEVDGGEQTEKLPHAASMSMESDLDAIIEKKLQTIIQIQKEYTIMCTNRLGEAIAQHFALVGMKLGEVQENIKMLKDELNQVRATINETIGDRFPKPRSVTPAPRKPSPVRTTPNTTQAPSAPPAGPADKINHLNSTELAVANHFQRTQLTNDLASKMMNFLPPTSMSGRLPPLPGLGNPYMNPGLLPPQFNQTQQMAAAGLALQQHLFEKEAFLMQERERHAHEAKKPSKRQKITDTRLSPRAAQHSQTKREMMEADVCPEMPPNSMPSRPIPAPGPLYPHLPGGLSLPAGFLPFMNMNDNNNNTGELRRSPASGRYGSERTGSDQGSISPSDISAISSSHLPHIAGLMENLTPVHLRKAKLMFFYRRSPKPLYIKSFFPDVHFTKQNTEQIVKWFSNFREFYYQQVDKYARHFLKDGLEPEDVVITRNSEVVKNLNVHYNRNNQIEIPEKFLRVVVISIQEFMKAIKKGDDRPTNPNGTSSGWRKPIYKVVERYEDDVPEMWKTQEWLEALGNDIQQM